MMSIAARGEWPAGYPPYGYKRGAHKDNVLHVDERKAVIVRDIFELYASDKHTTREIVHKYKNELSKSKVLSLLRNPTYIGKIYYAGSIFNGKSIAPESVSLSVSFARVAFLSLRMSLNARYRKKRTIRILYMYRP